MKEEAERRNQRLQDLYRKQREVAKTTSLFTEVPVAPVQKRLQETYNKLLLEEEMQTQYAAPSSQMVLLIHTKHKHIIDIQKSILSVMIY